jgi:hypothetical protein
VAAHSPKNSARWAVGFLSPSCDEEKFFILSWKGSVQDGSSPSRLKLLARQKVASRRALEFMKTFSSLQASQNGGFSA